MGVGEARPRDATFVDERVQVTLRNSCPAPLPSLRNDAELLVIELSEGTRVPWHMDDYLLPFERRIQVGNDPHLPGAALWKHQGVWRRTVFSARTERALLELLGRRRVELWCRRARSPGTRRGDRDNPACQPVKPKIRQRARGRA